MNIYGSRDHSQPGNPDVVLINGLSVLHSDKIYDIKSDLLELRLNMCLYTKMTV